jgi:hypothetical protein
MPVPRQQKESGVQISWTTITYRSVAIGVVLLILLAGFVFYIVFPGPSRSLANGASDLVSSIFEKTGLLAPSKGKPAAGAQQAHFTAIDGTVRVKKVNSNTWVNGDYALPLEKGDVVQTGSEGMAKVVFADGTNYTVKQDSLIVIEDNSTNAAQQTSVAVQVTTGTVDLTTATYSQGSKSAVIVAGATATLSPESAAQVRNDPRADQHEILVSKGSGEVTRGSEVVHLTDFEKVSFKADSPKMAKEKEVGPPTLIAPANMMPIFSAPGANKPVAFSWTQVPNTKGFHLRVSRNPYFSSLVFDKRVPGTDVQVSGMTEGAYYWSVQSVDDAGKESVESEKNRFTIIPKGTQDVALALELETFVQHGHVIEVRGKTEASARVMVNGEEVPFIATDGTFHYFTPPLPNGENVITITAQNSKGGVNTQQKKIVIQ